MSSRRSSRTRSPRASQTDPNGFNAVVHKGINGNIHELARNGPTWSHGEIAPLANEPIAGKLRTTDPSVFIRNDETDHVLYGLPSNHVGTLTYDVGFGWSQTDLTFSSGETP